VATPCAEYIVPPPLLVVCLGAKMTALTRMIVVPLMRVVSDCATIRALRLEATTPPPSDRSQNNRPRMPPDR
jgi:hypothetical protein